MPITTNQSPPSGYVTIRANATEGLRLNSNTSFSGANTVGEVVNEMSITNILWSGDWVVNRGANTVAEFTGSGSHNYQEHGVQLEQNDLEKSANVSMTLTGTGNIVVKLHKKSGQI